MLSIRKPRYTKQWLALLAMILLLVGSPQRATAAPGDIATVAGNGSAGFSGDGEAATSTSLNGPYGVTVDGAGNL